MSSGPNAERDWTRSEGADLADLIRRVARRAVYPVAAHAPPGKSYELWMSEASLGAPRPLGVIGEDARAANLAAYDRAVVEKATYAVTLEPAGGSPDGRPSGQPVFSGKLIPVEP